MGEVLAGSAEEADVVKTPSVPRRRYMLKRLSHENDTSRGCAFSFTLRLRCLTGRNLCTRSP
jgi:hypothetical protein